MGVAMKGFKQLINFTPAPPTYTIPATAGSLESVLSHLREHLPIEVLLLTIDQYLVESLKEESGGTMEFGRYQGKVRK